MLIWLITTLNLAGAFVLIAAGSVALIMGFLWCWGAKQESSGLLGLVSVFHDMNTKTVFWMHSKKDMFIRQIWALMYKAHARYFALLSVHKLCCIFFSTSPSCCVSLFYKLLLEYGRSQISIRYEKEPYSSSQMLTSIAFVSGQWGCDRCTRRTGSQRDKKCRDHGSNFISDNFNETCSGLPSLPKINLRYVTHLLI